VISPYLPYHNVGHAGGKAIFDFILQLKKRGVRVCLISLAWPHEEQEFESLRRLCDDTHLLVSTPVFTDSFLRSFQANVLRFFPKILRGCIKHLRIRSSLNRAIRDMIRRHEPDVIQVEYSAMALYLIRIKSAGAKVAHLHDVMIKPYQRRWTAERSPLRHISRWLFFLLVKYCELSFCRAFDEVLVKSEHDRAVLLQHGKFRTSVFPLGIEPANRITGYADREHRSVLFLGAMFREVNEQAAFYFVEQVLPILENEVGPVKFYIVGMGPSEQLRRLDSPKIVVTGFVEDVAQFYGRCQVFVAPLFIGGGMIYKVVQAMSFGLPVVASAIANEGIMARDNEEILLAGDPREFVRKIAALMNDPPLWMKLSGNSRRLVEERFSWGRIAQEYLAHFKLC